MLYIALTMMFAAAITLILQRQATIKAEESFREDLLIFKLRSIYNYYPELRDKNIYEVVNEYDVEDAYNKMRLR